MKFTAERDAFLAAVAAAGKVVERRNTIPILSNILIRAEGNALSLTATDLDMEITLPCAARTETPGATTLPAALLHDILRKMPAGAEVAVSVDGQQAKVTAGRARFAMQCLPEADFPTLTAGSFTHSFAISSKALAHMLGRAAFAQSTEETRYYLNGCFLHVADGADGPALRCVATDGHRLARLEAHAPAGSGGMPGVIIPRKTVETVMRMAGEAKGDAALDISDTKIRFSIGTAVLTSKLIDGTFPDYQRVIPTGNDRSALLGRAAFAAAADRVSAISSERGRAVKLTFAPGELAMAVRNPDTGDAEETMACAFEGEALEIGFNASYLTGMLGVMDGEEVEVLLADAGSPTILRDPADPGELFVLMPMRV